MMKSIYKKLTNNEIIFKVSDWESSTANFETASGEVLALEKNEVDHITTYFRTSRYNKEN